MAVYTEIGDDELRVFTALYDIGEVLSCKGIAEGVENSNFLLTTERANFILTLYEKRVARADLPFFIALMDHLAHQGVACPTPVRARDGEALRELGGALARLHLAGESFPMVRPNGLGVAGWRPLYEGCRARAGEVHPGLAAELGEELAFLEASWPRDLPTVNIHAELFPDNVFFRDRTLSGLIDFYFACTEFLAYDIAICLNAWCFETDLSFNVTKARLLVQSYRAARPLAAAELAALPLLARGSALRFLLTRLYDWLNQTPGALVRTKDPLEYLKKLRFHRGIVGPGAYGIDV